MSKTHYRWGNNTIACGVNTKQHVNLDKVLDKGKQIITCKQCFEEIFE